VFVCKVVIAKADVLHRAKRQKSLLDGILGDVEVYTADIDAANKCSETNNYSTEYYPYASDTAGILITCACVSVCLQDKSRMHLSMSTKLGRHAQCVTLYN